MNCFLKSHLINWLCSSFRGQLFQSWGRGVEAGGDGRDLTHAEWWGKAGRVDQFQGAIFLHLGSWKNDLCLFALGFCLLLNLGLDPGWFWADCSVSLCVKQGWQRYASKMLGDEMEVACPGLVRVDVGWHPGFCTCSWVPVFSEL